MKKQLLCCIILAICGSAYAQVPSYVPSNGLVGWWPFNGNANDESGNGNNGTVNGAVSSNDRFGNPNKSYNTGDNMNILKQQFSSNFTNLTISCWFNTSNNALTQRIIVHDWVTNGGTFSSAIVNSNFEFKIRNKGNGYSNLNGGLISNNTWYYFTLTVSDTKYYLYKNASLVDSVDANELKNCVFDLYFGGDYTWPFYGNIDDIGIWNRALDSCEIKDLYLGSLGNCCSGINISEQPVNQGMYAGNAQFTCKTNDILVNYQWQTDLGTGWSNVSNAGQYSGSSSNTLKVANVTSSNNNQKFRCIIKGNCLTDTTQEATLIVWGLGIKGINLPEFKLYPNPSSNAVTIAYSQNPYSIAVYNSLGQMVLSQSALTNELTFDISQWPKGVYYIELIDAATQTNKVQKLIRN